MGRIRWIGLVAALGIVPGVALASTPSARSMAEKQCRLEQKNMVGFKATYGTNKNKSNAFGKCVSHRTTQNSSDENSAQTSAESQCRSQETTDSSFKGQWGTGKNGSNAFGKCVSQTARAMADKDESNQVSDEDNAARQCRDEQKPDPAAFKAKYGTNANKSNAFGKCVSQKAHAMEQQQSNS